MKCTARGCTADIPAPRANRAALLGRETRYCSPRCASRESSAALRARRLAEKGAATVVDLVRIREATLGGLSPFEHAGYDAMRYTAAELDRSRALYLQERALFDRSIANDDSFGWLRIIMPATGGSVVIDFAPREAPGKGREAS